MKTNKKIGRLGWRNFFVILVLWLYAPVSVFGLEEVITDTEQVMEETTLEEVQIEVTKEDILNYYSDGMEFSSKEVVIQPKVSESVLVSDILGNIQVEELMDKYMVENIYLVNELGEILELTSIVSSNTKLVILGQTFIYSYEIIIFGDYNQDGMVNEEDVDVSIDFNIQDPEKVTTEDVSYIDYVVDNQTYEKPVVEQEEVKHQLENVTNNSYVGEEVVLEYSIQGLEQNYVNTISGELIYDDANFQLEGIDVLVDGEIKGSFQDKYFIYLLDNYQEEEAFLVFHFLVLKGGEQVIGLQNVKAVMNGELLHLNSFVETTVLVEEYGIGGDVWEEVLPENIIVESTYNEPTVEDMVFVPKGEKENRVVDTLVATTVQFSNNNYIEKLEIKGYDISFDKDVYEYQIEVDSYVSSLDLDIVLSDNNSEYFISGNEDFKEGQNEVRITVLAEDGSSRDYVILVNKKREKVLEKEEKKKEENDVIQKGISVTILVFLMISIIWCLYLFMKKEE